MGVVASDTSLDITLEGPIAVAALMSDGQFGRLAELAPRLVVGGCDVMDLREAAYVGALFCGFPRGVAALGALAEIAPERVHDDPPAPSRADQRSLGEALFRTIHRRTAQRQLDMLATLHRDFADTVLSEAYGRVLSRERLPLATRELVGATSLAVQDLIPQLRAHLRGAFNTGTPWRRIDGALGYALRLVGRDGAAVSALVTELAEREAS